jgi:hypothetical protein
MPHRGSAVPQASTHHSAETIFFLVAYQLAPPMSCYRKRGVTSYDLLKQALPDCHYPSRRQKGLRKLQSYFVYDRQSNALVKRRIWWISLQDLTSVFASRFLTLSASLSSPLAVLKEVGIFIASPL